MSYSLGLWVWLSVRLRVWVRLWVWVWSWVRVWVLGWVWVYIWVRVRVGVWSSVLMSTWDGRQDSSWSDSSTSLFVQVSRQLRSIQLSGEKCFPWNRSETVLQEVVENVWKRLSKCRRIVVNSCSLLLNNSDKNLLGKNLRCRKRRFVSYLPSNCARGETSHPAQPLYLPSSEVSK